MTTMHLIGVNFPRWRFNGEPVFADMIQTQHNGWLNLESGARVELTDDLAQSGPHGYGDFVMVKADASGMTDDVTCVAGAVFAAEAQRIPHALDVPAVSADPQAGRKLDQPVSGDPEDALAMKPSGDDPIAAQHEATAQKASEDRSAEG